MKWVKGFSIAALCMLELVVIIALILNILGIGSSLELWAFVFIVISRLWVFFAEIMIDDENINI